MAKTWSDRSRDDGILSGRKSGRELFGGEVVWHHGSCQQKLLVKEWSDGGGRREIAGQVLARQRVE